MNYNIILLLKSSFKKGTFIKDKQTSEGFIILESLACPFRETCHDSKYRSSVLETEGSLTKGACEAIILRVMKITEGHQDTRPILSECKMTCSKYFDPVITLEDFSESNEGRDCSIQKTS
jgi:hypothetical protein